MITTRISDNWYIGRVGELTFFAASPAQLARKHALWIAKTCDKPDWLQQVLVAENDSVYLQEQAQ